MNPPSIKEQHRNSKRARDEYEYEDENVDGITYNIVVSPAKKVLFTKPRPLPDLSAMQSDEDLESPFTLSDLAEMTDEEAYRLIPTPKGYYGGDY
jgi:hypothetical protein